MTAKQNGHGKKSTLYICYFGLREPLVQTQVLPYLKQLTKIEGLRVGLLTFEPNMRAKWPVQEIEAERKRLAVEGIEWHLLPYHKRPSVPATMYDILRGVVFVFRLARQQKIDIYHSRGHIPAPIGAIVKMISGGKLLFDIRGFLPEEYTDAGVWKKDGLTYRLVKRLEKWLMRQSDGFVVLTEKARDILFPESKETAQDRFERPVEVIPCCIDGDRFGKEIIGERERKFEGRVYVYVGSFGGWYMTDEIIGFYVKARQISGNSFLEILTPRDIEKVKEILREAGLNDEEFSVKTATPDEIPGYLEKADVAISFIKECYSKQSSSPTKIAEYLAAGLPVLASPGVGDLDALIEQENVGVLLKGFSDKDYSEALEKMDVLLQDKDLRERCRKAAYKYFDLESVGGPRYRRIYEKMLKG